MQRETRRINWPALGLATTMALVLTTGLPAVMQHAATGAPHVEGYARAAGPGATQVAIEPQSIEVVAVRERNANSRWFSLASFKRAG